MILGDYTFETNPEDSFEIIKSEKSSAKLDTYTGVAFFSWGMILAGTVILLKWNAMSTAMFDELDNIYQADASTTFVPSNDSQGDSYDVEIMSLKGKYHMELEGTYRKDVELELLITGITA